LLRRPSDNLSARDVTVPGLRVLNIKKNIKAGALNNPYVLANKVIWGILYTLSALLGGVKGAGKTKRISLIYNGSAFLLRTAFVFNLKFYFNNKLKVTNIIYYF